jgi:hypothetical protein
MTGWSYNPTLVTRVEQAIAFGRSFDWISEHLGATDRQIDKALANLDEAALHDDHAAELIDRGFTVGSSGRLVIPHGTHAAYNRHRAQRDAPCAPCVEAHRLWDRERKAAARRKLREAA